MSRRILATDDPCIVKMQQVLTLLALLVQKYKY